MSKYRCRECGAQIKAEISKAYSGKQYLETVYLCGSKKFIEFSSQCWIEDFQTNCKKKSVG